MKLKVNGKEERVQEGCSLYGLVQRLGLHADGVAIALNQQVVPRSQHSCVMLKEADRVEIVQAVGGG